MDGTVRDDPREINAIHAPPPQARAVRAALDEIRPGLLADGGNVELLAVQDDGTIRIALQGACRACPAAGETLRRVIEPFLRRSLAGVTSVMAG